MRTIILYIRLDAWMISSKSQFRQTAYRFTPLHFLHSLRQPALQSWQYEWPHGMFVTGFFMGLLQQSQRMLDLSFVSYWFIYALDFDNFSEKAQSLAKRSLASCYFFSAFSLSLRYESIFLLNSSISLPNLSTFQLSSFFSYCSCLTFSAVLVLALLSCVLSMMSKFFTCSSLSFSLFLSSSFSRCISRTSSTIVLDLYYVLSNCFSFSQVWNSSTPNLCISLSLPLMISLVFSISTLASQRSFSNFFILAYLSCRSVPKASRNSFYFCLIVSRSSLSFCLISCSLVLISASFSLISFLALSCKFSICLMVPSFLLPSRCISSILLFISSIFSLHACRSLFITSICFYFSLRRCSNLLMTCF